MEMNEKARIQIKKRREKKEKGIANIDKSNAYSSSQAQSIQSQDM